MDKVFGFIMINGDQVDMRSLSMCIARALEEIKGQGIPEARRDQVVDIGLIAINATMLSFALELALKGALQRANGEYDYDHDLKKLYEDLPDEDQQRIIDQWGEIVWLSQEAKDMGPKSFFSQHRRDFMDWRYMEPGRMAIRDHDMYGALMAVNAASNQMKMKVRNMTTDTEIIYEELKEVARRRQTGFYSDLSERIGLSPQSRRFHQILDEINEHEHREERPLLSALVVRRGFRIPSNGFFSHAEKLGRYDSKSGDATSHAVFWVEEVHRIWDYWQSP